MALDIRDAVYSGIANQFPAIYQEDGEFLVSFVEAYYKHLDEKMDRNLPKLRDIDSTLSSFIIYYKKKFLADLPIDTELDISFIIKHIQDMYRRKGTQESLELLFRMFFNEDIEIFYPSTAVLRPSDSIWGGDAYLEMKSVFTVDDYDIQKGMRIRGDVSLATAFVDEVIFVNFSGALVPLVYLSNISGTFSADDGIQIVVTGSNGSEQINNVGRLVAGSISVLTVDLIGTIRLPDQAVGDKVKFVSSNSGIEGEGRVSKISDTATGVIDFQIIDGGFGYVDPTSATLTAKNEVGISNQVMVLSTTTPVDIGRGDIIIARGDRLTYTGSDTGTKYAITGSAKVIQYEHPLVFLYSDDYNTVKTYLNATATPTIGTLAGQSVNVFIESMRNAAHKAYYDALSQVAPQYLTTEYTSIYKALQLPNQQFPSDSNAGRVNTRSLAFYFGDDLNNSNPASTTLSTVGVASRQILQEYINVLNLSGSFPSYNPELYDGGHSDAVRDQWRSYFESIFLALSKVDIFPQMVISADKTTGPTTQQNIVQGQYYMIWDNGDGIGLNWIAYGASTSSGIEGEIFQATQTKDFALAAGSDEVLVIEKGSLTTQQLQNYHLNRLRYDQLDGLFPTLSSRIPDKSGSVIATPSVTSPLFTLTRYRGDLARYDSSVSDITKVVLDTSFQSFGVSNRSADFEIGALTNVETVTLIPDLIGDFALIPLDIPEGQVGGAAGTEFDDYGMSGSGAENLGSTLYSAFNPITLKIGTISQLNVLNSGVDFQNDVGISIENTNISKFSKKDAILNFDTIDFDISSGDIVTQEIKIPDLQINQSGNLIHTDPEADGSILLESLGSSTVGNSYENTNCSFEFTTGDTKDYTVRAKFIKRSANDFYFRPITFYGFEGNLSLSRMNGNQEYMIVSLGNISTDDWVALGASSLPKVGEIFTSASDTVIASTLVSGDRGTVIIPASVGGFKKRITRIAEDANSLSMGANAEISGKAQFQSGQIDEVTVSKTGFLYQDRETVDIVNNEPTSANYNKSIAKAAIRVLGQGKTGGKWSSKTSFLSESSKRLHDNDYYQEYSYEVSSIVNPSKYESLIKDTVGVAGTKLFSKPLVNSINVLDDDLSLEISTFNIVGQRLATIKPLGVESIVAGTEYTITVLGDTTTTQWASLGVDINSTLVQGAPNLVAGKTYTIMKAESVSTWSDVQFISSEDRAAWWQFWFNLAGGISSSVYPLPDVDGSGSITSLDVSSILSMVVGTTPITPEVESYLNSLTQVGNVFENVLQSVGSYDIDSAYISSINSVVFSENIATVGQTFIASVNGSSLGTGKVSYKDSLLVTPAYIGDTYSPQSIRVPTATYTDLDGNTITDPAITDYPVDNKFYVVHSMEKFVASGGILYLSMDIGSNTVGASTVQLIATNYWNNIIDSNETAVDANDSNTWPRVGTIFKADSPTATSTLSGQMGDAKLAEITDSLTQFSDSDVSGFTITKVGHGFVNDTLVQYNQYLGTSSGNLIGNTTANRAAEYEYYYAVNVTDDTFQLSKTHRGTDDDNTTHVPIDLSGITGGPHILVRQTSINADNAILIGIQEQ